MSIFRFVTRASNVYIKKKTIVCLLYAPQVKTNSTYMHNDAYTYSQGEREKKYGRNKHAE